MLIIHSSVFTHMSALARVTFLVCTCVIGLLPLLLHVNYRTVVAHASSDQDGDGYVQMVDWDDLNPDVYPNAPELCDGIDNNQNGFVDESSALNVHMWFADMDGDGFGDANHVAYSCERPLGYVANRDDPDDLNRHVPIPALADMTLLHQLMRNEPLVLRSLTFTVGCTRP